jgi:glutamine synthetase
MTAFLAPYVNSYKRFCVGHVRPHQGGLVADNRTAGFRVCGEGTPRPCASNAASGADLNPYLACAALLAAGLDGIERSWSWSPR